MSILAIVYSNGLNYYACMHVAIDMHAIRIDMHAIRIEFTVHNSCNQFSWSTKQLLIVEHRRDCDAYFKYSIQSRQHICMTSLLDFNIIITSYSNHYIFRKVYATYTSYFHHFIPHHLQCMDVFWCLVPTRCQRCEVRYPVWLKIATGISLQVGAFKLLQIRLVRREVLSLLICCVR